MKRVGKSSFLVLMLAVLIALSFTAQAAVLTTVDPATWVANVAPGSYLEQFAAVPAGPVPSGTIFQGPDPANTFSYAVTAPAGLFGIPGALSTSGNGLSGDLLFTFAGLPGFTPVTAIGGNFFSTDFNGLLDGGPITLIASLGDGTSAQMDFAGTSPATFAGFLSDGAAFTSLEVIGGPDVNGNFPTVANFQVGASTVPEPGTFGLLGGALVGLSLLAKRWMR